MLNTKREIFSLMEDKVFQLQHNALYSTEQMYHQQGQPHGTYNKRHNQDNQAVFQGYGKQRRYAQKSQNAGCQAKYPSRALSHKEAKPKRGHKDKDNGQSQNF
jgi:hypothetical protein